MRSALVLGLLLLTGCGSKSPRIETPDAGETIDEVPIDAGSSEVDAGTGRYRQGVYLCCAKGEGRTCCPPDTLPDPSTNRSATCFEYGGVTRDCTHEGHTMSARDICSKCCDGTKRLEAVAPGKDGTCEEYAPPGIFICGACGDAICGPGENRCNCPSDCPELDAGN
jgi:hypothetical protein